MGHAFDPRLLPDGGRSLSPALDLCAALALLEGADPRAWRRCRAAALRYVEAVRRGRFGPRVALDLLRRAVATWTPRERPAARRAALDARVPFWVGTAYALRWNAAASAGAGDAAHEADRGWRSAPSPGCWQEMRSWRHALHADLVRVRVRSRTCRAIGQERVSRSETLVAHAMACVRSSIRARAESRARLVARATCAGRGAPPAPETPQAPPGAVGE